MLAFITGASSGIGKEMARNLSKRGYDLIITARNEEKLLNLKNELETNVKVIVADLRKEEEVFKLYEKIKNEEIDIFINNAGFGTIGEFWKTDLETEINMIKVNDIAMHILFKLILKNMIRRECETLLENRDGLEKTSELVWKSDMELNRKSNVKEKYILNVSSLSGFMAGPFMSSYYATKAYMLNLTRGVYKELKMNNLNINVSVLCPGPIYTNFCDRAGVEFKTKYLTCEYTAEYAINKMFEKKLVVVPGFFNKCGHILGKILPSKLSMIVTSRIQKKKFKI